MNNKNFIIAFTLIAGVVLIQLVSKEQPNTLDNQKESNVISQQLPNRIRIGNLIARVPDTWKAVKPSSSCLLYTSPSPRDRQKTPKPSSA